MLRLETFHSIVVRSLHKGNLRYCFYFTTKECINWQVMYISVKIYLKLIFVKRGIPITLDQRMLGRANMQIYLKIISPENVFVLLSLFRRANLNNHNHCCRPRVNCPPKVFPCYDSYRKSLKVE